MSTAIGIWSLKVTPGKQETINLPADVRITNVALGDVLKDTSGRTSLKLTYSTPGGADEEEEEEEEEEEPQETPVTTVLCTLKPNTVGAFYCFPVHLSSLPQLEQTSLELVLQEEETYVFEVVGSNTVYLTGNYIDQNADHPPFGGDDDSDFDSEDEDAYDLREVSSDVEMHPDDLDGVESDASRFEEIEEAPKNLKRAREADEEEPAKLSKAEKKKQKKQKTEAAKAADAAPEAKQEKEASKEKAKAPKEEAPKTKAVEKEIAGGIKVLDAKVGTGPMAKKGNRVSVRYIGKLTSGKVFDQNTKGKPFTFNLGKSEVIKGWDEGIAGMQVGGERKLTIPPAMAYGSKGTPGIPKNSTLIFEVKLLEIK
ncbi:hypothetical protein H0H92_009954 [Tricholoma furcatifolium]|nr:hypothetical protein H0H92_009954 [Tricholoma furcatifolium]